MGPRPRVVPFSARAVAVAESAVGHLFAVAVPCAVLALICVLLTKEVPVRTTTDVEDEPTPARELRDVSGDRVGAPSIAESLVGLEHEVGILVRRIRRVLAERARAVDPKLSTPSFLMLTHLAESGAQRSADIVEHFDIDKGAISRQVHQLSELGLVTRTPDPQDGRAQLIEVTEEGHTRLRSMAEQRRSMLVERLSDWEDGDLATFVGLLGRYNASLSTLSEVEPDPGLR